MSETRYLRFTVSDRIEHWIQMASFTILGLTGVVQKYATASLSIGIIRLLGGIEFVRIIHRTAAVVMMVAVVYHIGGLLYRLYVRRVRPTILPGINDVQAAWQAVKYNLGLDKRKPQQGRFTFEEKAEYWAFVWGTLVQKTLLNFQLRPAVSASPRCPGLHGKIPGWTANSQLRC